MGGLIIYTGEAMASFREFSPAPSTSGHHRRPQYDEALLPGTFTVDSQRAGKHRLATAVLETYGQDGSALRNATPVGQLRIAGLMTSGVRDLMLYMDFPEWQIVRQFGMLQRERQDLNKRRVTASTLICQAAERVVATLHTPDAGPAQITHRLDQLELSTDLDPRVPGLCTQPKFLEHLCDMEYLTEVIATRAYLANAAVGNAEMAEKVLGKVAKDITSSSCFSVFEWAMARLDNASDSDEEQQGASQPELDYPDVKRIVLEGSEPLVVRRPA
jgi:hypothetical protein